MVSCFIPDCDHLKNKDFCKFFPFPKEKALFDEWISLISCPEAPTAKSRVCSCHFVDGKVENKPTLHQAGVKRSLRIKKRLVKKKQKKEDKELIVDVDKGEADHTYFRIGKEKPEKKKESKDGKGVSGQESKRDTDDSSNKAKSSKVKKKEKSPTKTSDSTPKIKPLHKTRGKREKKSKSEDETSEEEEDTSQKKGSSKKQPSETNESSSTKPITEPSNKEFRKFPLTVDWSVLPKKRTVEELDSLKIAKTNEEGEAFPLPLPRKRMKRGEDIDEKAHFSWLIQPPKEDIPDNQNNMDDKETQTPGGHVKLDVLTQAENYFLKRDLEVLKEEVTKLKKQSFGYDRIVGQEKLVTYYTGFPNKRMAELFFSTFDDVQIKYHYKWKVETLNRRDQMLMTLMKFRHNFSPLDLSVRFGISSGTVCNIAMTWIHAFEQVLPSFVQVEDGVAEFAPGVFTQCRMILDVMEIEIDGNEKNKTMLHGVVGLAANGMVIFTSQLHPIHTSCGDIIHESTLWEQLEPGDLVVAVREGILPPDPPTGIHTEVITMPKVRMVIDRTLSRIRTYEILSRLPRSLLNYATQVWRSCCFLANYHHPIIKQLDSSTFEQPSLPVETQMIESAESLSETLSISSLIN